MRQRDENARILGLPEWQTHPSASAGVVAQTDRFNDHVRACDACILRENNDPDLCDEGWALVDGDEPDAGDE